MLSQSSSDNPCTDEEVILKEESEFIENAKEEYWVALHSSITPPDEAFYPKRPARFFYVQTDGASVEENCIHLFRNKWNLQHVNNLHFAYPRDLQAKREIPRNGPFFWTSFTPTRIQRALALHRSQGASQILNASDMNEPAPDTVPVRRGRDRPCKDKGIAFEDGNFTSSDPLLPGWNPGFVPGDGSIRAKSLFRKISSPTSLLGGTYFSERCCEGTEVHSQAIRRLERRGTGMVSAELARRACQFEAEFEKFKKVQEPPRPPRPKAGQLDQGHLALRQGQLDRGHLALGRGRLYQGHLALGRGRLDLGHLWRVQLDKGHLALGRGRLDQGHLALWRGQLDQGHLALGRGRLDQGHLTLGRGQLAPG
ncbi:hypothetical protein Bca101_082669 [Brassica carinata]